MATKSNGGPIRHISGGLNAVFCPVTYGDKTALNKKTSTHLTHHKLLSRSPFVAQIPIKSVHVEQTEN